MYQLSEKNINPLALDISSLNRVGPKTVNALSQLGIFSLFDLLLRVPKSTVTQNESLGFRFMEAGRVYIAKGEVFSCKISGFSSKKRLEVLLQDHTGLLSLIFFGPAAGYMQEKLVPKKVVTVSGEVKMFLGRPQMAHPKILGEIEQLNTSKSSNYSQMAGINSTSVKKLMDLALSFIDPFEEGEHLPSHLLTKLELNPLWQSFLHVHKPTNNEKTWDNKGECKNFKRLAFEELLSFYLKIFKARTLEKAIKAKSIFKHDVESLAKEVLPFSLTNAQKYVLEEIFLDMSTEIPMLRLLQGDVGSGKTAVSAIASFNVFKAGLQVAVMAPTEILAEQLFNVYQSFFKEKPAKIELLTSSTKAKKRREILEGIALGHINILIGTHALLTKDVIFKNLGLFIIDEQHRFGVNQRASILNSCEKIQGFSPHLLVMSATPIPRSLALTFYNDLDLSVINERPKGRLPIETKIFSGPVLSSLTKMCQRIIETDKKAFIVFPLVEESETLDLENTTRAYALIQNAFGKEKVLMVHGKMKPLEKQLAMDTFKNTKTNFLVSTSVVEVGVDIKDASVMIIVHPERFGLAQLHQLRGRVGRSNIQSFCFLLTDIVNRFSTAFKRLDTLCQSQDGFYLAQADLEQRGPGELLGTKQSGALNFQIFNHQDFASLALPAKIYAQELMEKTLDSSQIHLLQKASVHFS